MNNEDIAIDEILKPEIDAYIDGFNLELAISKALENSISLKSAKANEKGAILSFELSQKRFSEGNKVFDKYRYEAEVAKKTLIDAQNKVENDLRNKYNDFLTRYDDYNMANKYLELVNKKLDAVTVKYELGMVSRQEMVSQLLECNNAKLSIAESIYA